LDNSGKPAEHRENNPVALSSCELHGTDEMASCARSAKGSDITGATLPPTAEQEGLEGGTDRTAGHDAG
jgi:hypothetical protein